MPSNSKEMVLRSVSQHTPRVAMLLAMKQSNGAPCGNNTPGEARRAITSERGICDTARELPLSPPPVLHTLKKKEPGLASVHRRRLLTLHPDEMNVLSQRVEGAEGEERWAYVGQTREPR
jgi:hypothetical protein